MSLHPATSRNAVKHTGCPPQKYTNSMLLEPWCTGTTVWNFFENLSVLVPSPVPKATHMSHLI